MIPKTLGKMFCEMMRSKLNLLEGMGRVTSVLKLAQFFFK